MRKATCTSAILSRGANRRIALFITGHHHAGENLEAVLKQRAEGLSAPILDNNLCEASLKRAIMHRKNSLFYRSATGARAGDTFMSLIHSAELNGVEPFDYLIELLTHAEEVDRDPARWMPWNYPAAGASG